MTAFEWGLAIGSILGIVIGVCLAIIMIKVEGRRERRMGYVTVHSFGTGYAKPYLSGPGENPQVVGLVESPRPLTDEERDEALREWTRRR